MSFRRLIALPIAMAMVFAACSSGDSEPTATDATTAPTTEAMAEPDAPDASTPTAAMAEVMRTDLIVAYGDDDFVGSEQNRKRLAMYPLNANVCEPLVRLTPDYQVEGGIATAWEYVGDDTFRFTLRKGVVFHDGTALDSAAVVYTLDYVASEPSNSNRLGMVEGSSTAVDGGTVDITTEGTNLRLVEQINHPGLGMVASGTDPADTPVCTGPFSFVEYTEEDHLSVARNDAYWGDPAMLETITFRFIPDEATRALALLAGEVDVIADFDRTQAASLEAEPGIKVIQAPPGQTIIAYLALRGADDAPRLTSELAVREAISAAIDREAYAAGILDGLAEVINSVSPPSVLGEFASLTEGPTFDQAAAAQILDDAGWVVGGDGVRERDGVRLSLALTFDPRRITLPTAEFFQAMLAAVGIESEITQHADATSWREQVNSGDFDINIEAPNQNDANPAFLLALRWYSEAGGSNVPFVSPGPDSAFDALIAQTLVSADREELKRLAGEAMHELIDVEVAVVPLVGVFRLYAMRDEVQGFVPHPSGINQRWDTVYWGP